MLVTSTPSHQLCHAAADNYYSNFPLIEDYHFSKLTPKQHFFKDSLLKGNVPFLAGQWRSYDTQWVWINANSSSSSRLPMD